MIKIKRLYILISCFILIFLAYLSIRYLPKDYSLTYTINEVEVIESYSKKTDSYLYILKYKNQEYPLIVNQNYIAKRKNVTKIVIKEESETTCLDLSLKNSNHSICQNEKELIDYRLLDKEFLQKHYPEYKMNEEKLLKTLNNVSVYNTLDKTYLIWNYNGYYKFQNNQLTTKTLFKKDNYENLLTYQTERFLVIPDYDSKYFFQKVYCFDLKNNKEFIIETSSEISYDSYFLGDKENILYLVDKKNKAEYKIDLKKKKIKNITDKNDNGLIYDNEWASISMTKLVNKEYKFSQDNLFKYFLEDNTLYLKINSYNIKISNLKVNKIILATNIGVYYLVNDSLYYYDLIKGEVKLLKYSEWSFNYNNQIFIFD